MNNRITGSMIGLAMGLALSACGGGGGQNLAPGLPPPLTPTPTPTPTPPPTPTPTPSQVGPFGITADTTFGTAGDAEFRWNETDKAYEMKTSDMDWVKLTKDGSLYYPKVFVGYGVSIGTTTDYSYTNTAAFLSNNWGEYVGGFVFGLKTSPSDVPTTGSAQYQAQLSGLTSTPGYGYWDSYSVGGTAQLDFDFGAGTLSGYMDPVLDIYVGTKLLPRYTFAQTVYAKGSNEFSGSFLLPDGLTGPSSFSGFLSGPKAVELGGKYSIPFWDDTRGGDKIQGTIKGLFIGKKK